MRRLSLLAAVLLAAAPLLTGCADDFATDTPSALASADAVTLAADSPATANAVMHCARLDGPNQLNPGQSASYTFDVAECGILTSSVNWTISGDGAITSQVIIDDAKTEGGTSTVQVRASNIQYGTFTLTASYRVNGNSHYGSISRYVTVGTRPVDPPTTRVNLRAAGVFNGINVTWDVIPVLAGASCTLSIEQYSLDGTHGYNMSSVPVSCQSGRYLDGRHTTRGARSLDRVIYRLSAKDAQNNPVTLSEYSALIYAIPGLRPEIAVAYE